MIAKSVKVYSLNNDGTRIVDAFIIADTVPATLPTTGEGIEGLLATDTFAPFSKLYVIGTGALYLANTKGTFVAQ